MKNILGLDLGTTSIGWALVNEAENKEEKSSIIKIGVRVNPLTTDEQKNFDQGKSITTNADRTLKRSMRRNLQRYKLRREFLKNILIIHKFITEQEILSEDGNKSTFETYRLRAKSVTQEVSLLELARILFMINKKRGYKSSRKAKSDEEGQLIDGMDIATTLYENNITPGQYVLSLLKAGKKYIPDFYRSDLQSELDRIWSFQYQFYPEILTSEFKEQISGKGKINVQKIFLAKYQLYTADNKSKDKRLQTYIWRSDALSRQLSPEELAYVISEVNGNITNSSGYLGSISDRSKELFFNKQTVGQFLMIHLDSDPNYSLKNQIFYRQDYLDEFEQIWETQSQFHTELTPKLKAEIRDVIIFYQRPLKSQKGLISFCEFESKQIGIEVNGVKKKKMIGLRVAPKSSPLFQEFKIWQVLNDLDVSGHPLAQEDKELLFKELTFKEKLSSAEILKIIRPKQKILKLKIKEIKGNNTQFALYKAYQTIVAQSGHGEYDFNKMNADEIYGIVSSVFKCIGVNEDILKFNADLTASEFEHQPMFQLWHLLYSFEGDDSPTGNEKLIKKIQEKFGFEKEYATTLANVFFQPDYCSLSSKAIRGILHYMKEGYGYSVACTKAGYRHSEESLTKEELDNKILKDKLEQLPKNSLRNPVVEKILNQLVNVVNQVITTYGKPDEIRIELARELKKSAKEREAMTKSINQAAGEHEKYIEILQKEFGLIHISRNDIIRYKLYLELAPTGYHTLYSNTYISKEKLFSRDFDIEHIIPQAKLFDDSFSNKTLESRAINIEKKDMTAYDYVLSKYGESGVLDYSKRIDYLDKEGSKSKYKKLKMTDDDIPTDFINRDLRDSQYIAKKAKSMLLEIVRDVVSTTGSITDRLREDWQLINVMQELNWDKYDQLGLTEVFENKEGQKVYRIQDWTKRNDHRHHAMDALTIAFTKLSYIQYLNNLNARSNKSSSIFGIEQKELYRDAHGKLRFMPPFPLQEFRAESKKHLENILVSIKAKNKVVTQNINKSETATGYKDKMQLTPRGQLHQETIYGSIQRYATKESKVNASFDETMIATVAKKEYREALTKRLIANGNDPKKAFTGKNALNKNPLYINDIQTEQVPEKVKTVTFETTYTIRKEISKDIKVEKVIDVQIRRILEKRLSEYGGNAMQAFSNLEENPIWLNKEKGIKIKRVAISGVSNAIALHDKHDKEGNIIYHEGKKQPTDFVSTGNNHHVAIYRDENGNLQENVVSFFEATARSNQGLPLIDKEYKKTDGWQFLFTMKQNEYFVFPNVKTGFDPMEIDLMDPDNQDRISPNLFRVQKIATKDYFFRHHLETTVVDNKSLLDITYKRIGIKSLEGIIKVRINHIGQIIYVGEY
ncbi:MAG: type II CRISPR RNA-guided endonuclease Cas9 [Oscillospiraceae bacterium]